jgi:hypothetical protein
MMALKKITINGLVALASTLAVPALTAFLTPSLAPSAARAELKLDAPEVLLERAKQNRVGFLAVLRDIDKNIFEIRTRAEAETYVKILPELETVGAAQARDNMGATVFMGVANRLSNHALRWVRFELDTPDQLLLVHRYADPGAAYQLLEEHRDELAEITEMSERRRMADNLKVMQEFAVKMTWPRNVVAGYANLRSDVAMEALKNVEQMPEADHDYWIGHLSPMTGFESFLRDIHDRVLNYPNPDPVRFHAFASLLIKLKGRVDADPRGTPYFINVLLGDVSRDLITAHLYQEVLFTKNDFELLLKNMSRSHMQQFVNMINDSVFAVSAAYLPHFKEKGRAAVARLVELGMAREAELLRRRIDAMKVAVRH